MRGGDAGWGQGACIRDTGRARRPTQAAAINARTGETLSYAELDAASNRIANWLADQGLVTGDHVALFMENNLRSSTSPGPPSAPASISPASTATSRSRKPPTSSTTVARVRCSPRTRAPTSPRSCRSTRARRRALADERRQDRRLARPRGRRSPTASAGDRSATSPPATRCSIPRAPPAGPRASCARSPAPAIREGLRVTPVHRRALRLRRGLDLPLAGAALPRCALRLLHGHPVPRRHGRDDGALRPRRGAAPRRSAPHHAQPVGADDVHPHAQARRRRARRPST